MAVGYKGLPELHPVDGVRVAAVAAGIKKADRKDLVLFELDADAVTVATFTRNAFCAAPVVLAKSHLQSGSPGYLLINTGNANAGTGASGLADAERCCRALAAEVNCKLEQVLPFSTGVIGEPLPVERITSAIPSLVEALGADNWEAAANGILTTDTVPKGASCRVEVDGKPVTITGISKGSGMIRPDMGTMLSYIATDAEIAPDLLQSIIRDAVDDSFNRITVDGDTSTNDACVLVATGNSGVAITADCDGYQHFIEALNAVFIELAQLIVRDGEGASKFIAVNVTGGANEGECEQVAYTIAHSPLVKTALFASDPNWGRILAAVGRAGVDNLQLNNVTIHLGDVCIVSGGGRDAGYTEESGQAVMDKDEITIQVDLARGDAAATVWTCDLSYDYVRINAEYRT